MKQLLLFACSLFSISTFAQGDACGAAVALAVNATCTNTGFTNNENGQPEPGAVNASCATGTASSDVWYSITGTGGNVQVTLSNATRNACLSVWSNCPATTQIGCVMISSTQSGSIIFPTAAATTYYISIQRRSGGNNANMSGDICATSISSAAPANDNCPGATVLTAGATCTSVPTTNLNATNSAGIPAPGCASYSGGDVWYSVVVPASGSVNVETFANSLTDGGMAIYTGACAALNLIDCDDDSGNGLMPAISASGLTPGSTLRVRFWEYGGNANGTFGICATAGTATTGNQNCATGTQICSDASFTGNSNGNGTQELNATNQGCLSTEHQSSWYYFSPTTTGSISMAINPANGVDYDYAIWGPYNTMNCPVNTTPLRCSFASGFTSDFETGSYSTGLAAVVPGGSGNTLGATDGTGTDDLDGWTSPITVAAANVNKYYIMLIDNFSSNSTPFGIDFTLTCGLNCAPLPIELVDFSVYEKQTGNLVKWSTMTEINNDYFILEKSIDGNMWEQIAEVDGSGNTTAKKNYSFLDKDVKRVVNYYRLTQFDYNGTKRVHNIILIDNSSTDVILVKRVNQLGQEVKEDYKGMVIEVYSDGSTIKRAQY
ncbi:MAG: hypothetical protein K0R65_1079 [Crocinitomicaceae bacterium]|jgi:hypothetical protein|nr:hypothetical protein [Crocinitomicaceae bacterium]